MSATIGRDTIEGLDGPDSIDGLGGGDLIFANNGNDTVVSYSDSTIFGGGGNDLFVSRPYTNNPNDLGVLDDLTGAYLDGGDNGTDDFGRPWADTYLLTRLAAQFGVTLPFVNMERLAIRSPASSFVANGTASADYYDFYARFISIVNFSTGNLATLELRTGEGSDVVFAPAKSAGNYIYGGNDNDFIHGYDAPDFLFGDDGNDFLSGGANTDGLYGGNGNDCMIGGPGADTFFGGAASDFFVVLSDDAVVPAELMAEAPQGVMADGSFDIVIEALGEGNDTISASVSYTMAPAARLIRGPFGSGLEYSEVEALVLTGTDNINGTGNNFAQLLQGNSGNNRLDGAGGADTLVGDVGHDTLLGGTDTLGATFFGVPTNDNDSLLGGEGNDWLIGDIGNDTLNGGTGADTMDGGIGNDFYIVDNALDLVREAALGGSDSIMTSVSFAMPDQVEQIMIGAGVTGITITGNSGADIIIGNGLANNLNGGAGDDIILAQNITVQDILALFAFP